MPPNPSSAPETSGPSAAAATASTVPYAGASTPVPYDFRRPTKLSREHARALEVAYDTFARQWTTLLSSSLRVLVSIEPVRVEQRTYDEYVSGLPSPTTMAMFAPEPFPGAGILQWPLDLSMVCIDHMLGGAGGAAARAHAHRDRDRADPRTCSTGSCSELRYALDRAGHRSPRG